MTRQILTPLFDLLSDEKGVFSTPKAEKPAAPSTAKTAAPVAVLDPPAVKKTATTTKEERAAKVKETIQILEQGQRDILDSDRYRQYLEFCSRFHRYSYRNTILIMAQRSNATFVGGFHFWKHNGRSVCKGERAIKILAPNPIKITDKNEDGEEIEKEIVIYKVVHVFDVSQTVGEAIPSPCTLLDGSYGRYEEVLHALRSLSPVPIYFDDLQDGDQRGGYFSPSENKIVIRAGRSQEQTIKTTVHEITHALTHAQKLQYSDGEVLAESVAYIVCSWLGIDSSEYSFPYVSLWNKDEKKSLAEKMETIQKTACGIIESIEKSLSPSNRSASFV